MNEQKVFEFKGTAGTYFKMVVVIILAVATPFLLIALANILLKNYAIIELVLDLIVIVAGMLLIYPFVLNYSLAWIAKNTLVNGSQVSYDATLLETLKFMIVNYFLTIVTLGIYIFWVIPKFYSYIASHSHLNLGDNNILAPEMNSQSNTSLGSPQEII